MLVLRWSVLVLCLSLAAPAVAAPVIIAPPSIGPLVGISSTVSVAMGEEGGWAVWRIGPAAIWGVPLDQSGRPLGLARILLTGENVNQPAVHYFDGDFILLWENAFSHIQLARLGWNGMVEGRVAHTFRGGSPLASNDRFLMIRPGSGFDAFVELYGTTLRTKIQVPLPGVGSIFGMQAATLSDGSFAVVTTGSDGLYLTRIDADGSVIGSPLLLEAAQGTSAGAYRPLSASVATDGTSIFIAWSAGAYGEPRTLQTALVTGDGSIAHRAPVTIPEWDAVGGLRSAWADGKYTTFFAAGDELGHAGEDVDVMAFRSDANGTLVSPPAPVLDLPGRHSPAGLITTRDRHIVFVHHGSYGATEILTAGVPHSGPIERPDPTLAESSITQAPALQERSDVAAGGNEWLAVWLERVVGREEVRAVALHRDGTPKSDPIVLARQDQHMGTPIVSYNGVDYVVVWVQWGGAHFSRISRDGTLLETRQLPLSPTPMTPIAIASRPGLTVLAWGYGTIHGASIDAAGNVRELGVLSPPVEPHPEYVTSHSHPSLAASDLGFLLSWQIIRTSYCVGIPCPETSNAAFRLLDLSGLPETAAVELAERRISSTAGGRDSYLALFESGEYGRIIDARTGAASEPFEVFEDPGPFLPRALWRVDEFIALTRSAWPQIHRLRHISEAGVAGETGSVRAFTLPRVVNASGDLLALGPWSGPGAAAWSMLAAEVVDTIVPGEGVPSRRRGVRR